MGGRAGRPPLSAAGARRAHWGGSSPPPRTGPPATSPRPSPCGVFVFSLEVRHLHHVADLPTTLARGITPASGDFSTRVFSPRSSDRASSPTGLPLQQHVLLSPAGSRSVHNRYTPTCPLQHGTSFRRIRTWSEQSAHSVAVCATGETELSCRKLAIPATKPSEAGCSNWISPITFRVQEECAVAENMQRSNWLPPGPHQKWGYLGSWDRKKQILDKLKPAHSL